MGELLSSPDMITILAIVLIVEALSLLMLFLNIQLFRTQADKYRKLLMSLGNESTMGRPCRFVVPVYVILTLGAAVITTMIFIFQPHLL